jgi:hypothetical protein
MTPMNVRERTRKRAGSAHGEHRAWRRVDSRERETFGNDVEEFDFKEIAGLCALDQDWAREPDESDRDWDSRNPLPSFSRLTAHLTNHVSARRLLHQEQLRRSRECPDANGYVQCAVVRWAAYFDQFRRFSSAQYSRRYCGLAESTSDRSCRSSDSEITKSLLTADSRAVVG